MKLKLIDKKSESFDAATFVFEPEAEVSWQPGQFFHYVLNHEADDRGVERWFTISNAPYEKNITITTRIFPEKGSSFKKALNDLAIGSFIEGDGPKGKFILEDNKDFNVLVAGGIGITPYRSMIMEAAHHKNNIKGVLLYANRDGQFYYKDELNKAVSGISSLTIDYLTSNITKDDLLDCIPGDIKPYYYLSGPEPMVEYYEKMLLSMGFADEQIKRDFFPGYEWAQL